MIKILIKLKDNTIIFKEKHKLKQEYKSLINTNIISANELIFSDEYIINNVNIVSTFIKDICKVENIDTAIIESDSLYLLICNLFINNPYITSLILKDDTNMTYALCETILKTHLKNISCYSLQPFILELFDKAHILVESRSEILFLSNFMLDNNLNIFSSLFYKTNLNIEFPLDEQDEEDFKTFCKVNKYLKTIHVNRASLDNLEFIVDNLKGTRKKNVNIIIHDNIIDPKIIEYLKNFNKRKSKHYKIYFQLAYTDEYINNNLFKETNSKILQTCGLIIILIITCSFTYVFYDNYASMKSNEEIKESIAKVIDLTDKEKVIEDLNLNQDDSLKVINEDIASLLTINPEVVGWLKVNGTNIDYPILQSINNEYYLKHNFNLENDNNGWTYMDYRNDYINLNDNTIFYGHNRYYSGIMFGTLENVMHKSWYANPDNLTISFRTLYANYEFKVFSIYKIYKTNDYITTNFFNNDARIKFYEMLKNRSIFDFGITPKYNDKIITLSTCKDGDNRIVLHAVLTKTTTSSDIENQDVV